jgi:sulfate/thiosulfate transport system ATP-binding protein
MGRTESARVTAGVEIAGLTKRFAEGGAPAVAGVDLAAPSGAITALIGPSGAGKSTILRVIAGLEAPDAGVVRIAGEDVTRARVQDRGVGLVFQGYALFEHLDVRDNIGFGLRVRGVRKADITARVDELLALVQLETYGARRPSELSGGQRQRVAFARALAIRPRVLLLDEPFGALDARVRGELRSWLERLHEETGITTVLVTHDQTEALELAQHVVVLFDGRAVQAGSPEDVYDHPVNAAIARFLGASPVRGLGGPGDSAAAYVRPHDLRLERVEKARGGLVGRIERLRVVGHHVKVSLLLPDGEPLVVEISRQELALLGIQSGDNVAVSVKSPRLTPGNYAI